MVPKDADTLSTRYQIPDIDQNSTGHSRLPGVLLPARSRSNYWGLHASPDFEDC